MLLGTRKKWRWQEQQWHTAWGNGSAFPRRLRACRVTSTSAFSRPRPPSGIVSRRSNYQSSRRKEIYGCQHLPLIYPTSSRTQIPIYAPVEKMRVLQNATFRNENTLRSIMQKQVHRTKQCFKLHDSVDDCMYLCGFWNLRMLMWILNLTIILNDRILF